MKKQNPSAPSTPISIEYNGRVYHGSYYVAGSILTVQCFELGSKSTQVGPSNETIAKLMLRELAQEAKQ